MLDEKILSVLRTMSGNYVSGEELSKDAGISRAAIWKHVEELRAEGYEIEASPHLGYRLIHVPDRLIPQEVKWHLGTKIIGRQILSYKKVDSTNDVAYSLAEKGVRDGSIVFAEEQSSGKGRLGRKWISPAKGGIYMSCVLRPAILPNEMARITLMAAVAVAKAIRFKTGLPAVIKWPNDILVNNKKVCGILTEMKAEQDKVDFVVVGIGLNVNTPAGSLPKGASSLKEELSKTSSRHDLTRLELAQSILENIEASYVKLEEDGFGIILDEWKHLSMMIGSAVRIVQQNRSFTGQVYDVDSDGALLVRRQTGLIEKVSSGDVFMGK